MGGELEGGEERGAGRRARPSSVFLSTGRDQRRKRRSEPSRMHTSRNAIRMPRISCSSNSRRACHRRYRRYHRYCRYCRYCRYNRYYRDSLLLLELAPRLQLRLGGLERLRRRRQLERLAQRHGDGGRRQRRRRQLRVCLEATEGRLASSERGRGEGRVLVREEAAEPLPPRRVERGRVDIAGAEEEKRRRGRELLDEEEHLPYGGGGAVLGSCRIRRRSTVC